MLALKLFLVPFFLAAISLAGRRWGPGIAGWLAGLPVVAGPILLLLALENGAGFAARAASGSLAAVAAAAAFNLSYAWACARASWPLAAAAGVGAWAAMILLLSRVPVSPWLSLAVALAALAIAPRLFPKAGEAMPGKHLPRHELLLRMAAGAGLTLFTTGISAHVGAAWTGLLTIFPLMGIVLAVFSQRAYGPGFATMLLRAMIGGLYSLVAFCFSVAMLLPAQGVAVAFLAATAIALTVQGLVRFAPGLLLRAAPGRPPRGSGALISRPWRR